MSSYLLTLLAATAFATQTAPARSTTPKKTPAKPLITLTGCVRPDAATPGTYTFADLKTGAIYRLSGFDASKDAGKRGEIVVGSGPRRVTIRGGLVPSPNAAAQGGLIDPAQGGVAGVPSGTNSGTGTVQLPEFHATRIQALNGACP